MKRKLLCLFLFLAVAFYLDAEQQWYLISQSEIETIETHKQNLETDKKTLQSQVQKLNQQVSKLEKQSTTLQQQAENLKTLSTQQQTTITNLEKSYNELEVEKFQTISQLNSEKNTLICSVSKYKNRFIIALCIAILETVFIAVYIVLKIKAKILI